MRIVAEIPHPEFKITVFSWNGKFILKIEAGIYEQAFRISEESVGGNVENIKSIVDEEFIENCRKRFLMMREDLSNKMKTVNQKQA